MTNVIPARGLAPRHRFVMRKQCELPVKPSATPPPTKCRDCGAVDIWCVTCQTPHPIRRIEQHHEHACHVAHCDQDPTLTPMALKQPCSLAGKASADAALDPLTHERKREWAAAAVGIFVGIIIGIVITLATIVTLNLAYRPRQATEYTIER